ncbi:MAG: type II toxin-antitoxin system RelE/ParE family toxin [Elusimicrobiota bacterium]|jgi:putative addiction module killer protein
MVVDRPPKDAWHPLKISSLWATLIGSFLDISPIEVYFYCRDSGSCPFKEWLNTLDRRMQKIVDTRLTRLQRGLFGDAKHLGDVWELRFHIGPGFRIYFGREGRTIVILLHAGDKKDQTRDIETARRYWADLLGRTMR